MIAKGSKYKKIVTVIFIGGIKEEICCEGVTLTSSFTSDKPHKIDLKGAQYSDVYINPDKVAAIFIKDNPHYDPAA